MNDQFTFDEGKSGYNPDKYNRYAQAALSDLLNTQIETLRYQGLMDYGISLESRRSSEEPFKSANFNQGTEVATFDLVFNLNSEMVERERMSKLLIDLTTNVSLSKQILTVLNYSQALRNATKGILVGLFNRRFRDEIGSTLIEGRISIGQLAEILSRFVSKESGFNVNNIKLVLRRLFSEDPIEVESFFSFLREGDFRMVVPIVYKRIPQGAEALAREINFYEILSESGFNTFCAFNFLPSDEEVASYEFTVKRNSLKLLRESSTLLNPGDGLLESVFYEVGRLHSMGFVHGDLSFENIGYERNRDGKYVVFFDFIMSRLHEGDIDTIDDERYHGTSHDITVLISQISYFLNNYISNVIDEKGKFHEERYLLVESQIQYVADCFSAYISELRRLNSPGETGPLSIELFEKQLNLVLKKWREDLAATRRDQ